MAEERNLQQEELLQEQEQVVNEIVMEENKIERDYSSVSRDELFKQLSALVDSDRPLDFKSEIETLKSVFYLKLSKEHAEQKEAFIANGGSEEDFKISADDVETKFKTKLIQFRDFKNEVYKKIENEREENLKQKEELIEELKQLVEKEESLKDTFETFSSIQEKWRTIGAVPAAKNDDVWQRYHLHVEHFYDYIKINRELRDLDFKRNLECKELLCEKTEALAAMNSPIDAFKILQVYHQEWRETGPVSKDLREPLWLRFKAATTEINKRHQDYFTERKEQEMENLAKKEALCEKAEALASLENPSAKEWNDNVNAIQALQEEWQKIGHTLKKENGLVYRRFRKACDLFFKNKRDFYKQHKDDLSENLERKKELIRRANELKDSDDWKAATDELVNLQKEWKTIGAVHRKYSEKIWNQFREVCDIFFERKKTFFGDNDAQQEENLKLKNELIEKIKAFVPSESSEDDVKNLLDFKAQWNAIGHVPIKAKNNINNEYHNELNAQFDKLNLKREDREIEKFRSKLGEINDNSGDKVYAERKKLVLRLKELESEISTLDNNIGFLSKSKSSEGFIKEYTLRLDKAKKQKEVLSKKIRMIDTMD